VRNDQKCVFKKEFMMLCTDNMDPLCKFKLGWLSFVHKGVVFKILNKFGFVACPSSVLSNKY